MVFRIVYQDGAVEKMALSNGVLHWCFELDISKWQHGKGDGVLH